METKNELKGTDVGLYLFGIKESVREDLFLDIGVMFAQKYCSNLDGTQNKSMSASMLKDVFYWKWFRYAWENQDKIAISGNVFIEDYKGWKMYSFIKKSQYFVWWSLEQDKY